MMGLLVGVAFEASRVDEINEFYVQSELSLMDVFTMSNLVDVQGLGCDELIESNLVFADRVYEEARTLEKYDEASQLTEGIKLAHTKYDLLRTFLWINTIKIKEKCGEADFSSVVYLYETEETDLAKKATQAVWSKVLFDLKQEKGNEIILIPIAINNDLVTLNSLISQFEIEESPVVIINEEHVITELSSVEDLREYFD